MSHSPINRQNHQATDATMSKTTTMQMGEFDPRDGVTFDDEETVCCFDHCETANAIDRALIRRGIITDVYEGDDTPERYAERVIEAVKARTIAWMRETGAA